MSLYIQVVSDLRGSQQKMAFHMALLDLLPISFFFFFLNVFQGLSNHFKLFLVVLGM